MTEAQKQRLLSELEQNWQRVSTQIDNDLGGMASIVGKSAYSLAVRGELTKDEARQVHKRALRFESDFAELARTEGGRRLRQLKAYQTQVDPLKPFGEWWSQVEEEKELIRHLREATS